MKKYILILFGDFSSKELWEYTESVIHPIVDSKHLKCQNNLTSIIYHFESEVEQNELSLYIESSLSYMVQTFILSENNDKLSLYMIPELKKQFLDLENATENELNFKSEEILDSEISEDEFTEEFVASILSNLKEKIKKPSLNELLDKINESGLTSLSPFEKGVLEEYSKC